MKQCITLEQWNELPIDGKTFVQTWKMRKYQTTSETLTIGELLELLIATTYNLHTEDSDGRFFNYLLSNQESVVGWEGSELVDILWHEVKLAVRQRLVTGRTINEIVNDTP